MESPCKPVRRQSGHSLGLTNVSLATALLASTTAVIPCGSRADAQVSFEAETGVLGADFNTFGSNPAYITILTRSP